MQSRGIISAFEIYLRTGRRVQAGVELKFNPWHDPDDGRFTFAGQGRYFGGNGNARPGATQDRSAKTQRQSSSKRFGPRSERGTVKPGPNEAGNPRNHSIYIVRRGVTLTAIAARRKGIAADELARFNAIPVDRPLQIGQRIRVPHALRGNVAAARQYLRHMVRRRREALAKFPERSSEKVRWQTLISTNWVR